MSAQLQTIEPSTTAMTATQATTPSTLLQMAVQQGADLDRLERLMALQERWEANEARKAFHLALSEFKAQPLAVTKDKLVSINHKDGRGKTEYTHATLGNVVATIAPELGRHQLSHTWGVRREGDRVYVTCRLTHALGHSEEVTLDGPLDASGSKNNIQSMGSTITYLQRYTLLAITGLATEDQQDDDGRGADKDEDDKASIIASEWAETIAQSADLASLKKNREDAIAHYGMTDKVPPLVRSAFSKRKEELTPKESAA